MNAIGTDSSAPYEQEFVITAYYSPQPNQCCYVKGGYVADKILNGEGHTTADGESKKIEGDILALKPGGKWKVVGKLPIPLSSPVARVIGDKFYVAGGCFKWPEITNQMWVATIK